MFNLRSEERRRPLPAKILFAQRETETLKHILLKLFGFLLFHRERLQIEPSLDDGYLSFVPDLVQLDYTGTIQLWVECGECALEKLDRLAVKAPYAEIWAVKGSATEAADWARRLDRGALRRGRYGLVGLDHEMLDEITSLTGPRNDLVWYKGSFEPALMQFEYNGLWFESSFTVLRH